MKTSTIAWVVVVVLIIVAGVGYWYHSSLQVPQPAGNVSVETTASTTVQGDGTGVAENLILGESNSATLGTYLSAYNGMTVYTYNKDTSGISNCSGACATAWPPYTVASAASINVSAATTGTVGTIIRADGSLQVTYKGMPLYFWQGDKNPGDTTGQGVGGFSVAVP